MLNSANVQRALRPEGPAVTTPVLRRSGQGQTHMSLSVLRHSSRPQNVVIPNAQSYGRGQPPNQQQPMSLVRRPFYDPMEPMQPTYIKLSDVIDKDVISSTTGRKLGKLGEAWVDTSRLEVTCFDLESNGAIGVVPLLTVKQVGDVVLVQEDGVLRQPLDSRFGFTKLLGWEVRTPSNRALGKVRDVCFSRETGNISKIEFDDFGLRFLRADFFDRFSVSADAIRQCAYGIVSLAAENVQYQEKQGILSGILRRVGGAQQLAGLLADGSRGGEAAGLLPQGYSYEQWQNDVRMWEAQTGCSYEEYMMQTGQQQQQPYGLRRGSNALPPGRPQPQALLPEARQPGVPNYALSPPPGSFSQTQPRPSMLNPMPQQQPQGYSAAGQQPGLYGTGYSGGVDPRFRGSAPAQPPTRASSSQTRYPAGAGPQQPQSLPAQQQQQQQQQQQPQPRQWQQPVAQPQAMPGQQQWGQQPLQQSQQQQQPILQRPMPGAPVRSPAMAPGVGVSGTAAAARGSQGVQGQAPPFQSVPPITQQQLQPQPQQQQYGWPGPAPGLSGMTAGPEIGSAAQQPVGENGTASGATGSAMRVDEWLARGSQGQVANYEQVQEVPGSRPPTPGSSLPVQPAQVLADAPGWDLPGAGASRQPF
ncbi:hypothetical protein Vretimale_19360 [Volvox reticuliferus]|uniref:PRC-barrel domain-containing protein n=1 Tax=Volvox reticuliferus TaxID=1737510 RepID=A0A8J4M0H3_9CHLO|nr:hypothetical protein Vretimale_19360 [Volvox reticuliferus]